jgi:hypothetical protein
MCISHNTRSGVVRLNGHIIDNLHGFINIIPSPNGNTPFSIRNEQIGFFSFLFTSNAFFSNRRYTQ